MATGSSQPGQPCTPSRVPTPPPQSSPSSQEGSLSAASTNAPAPHAAEELSDSSSLLSAATSITYANSTNPLGSTIRSDEEFRNMVERDGPEDTTFFPQPSASAAQQSPPNSTATHPSFGADENNGGETSHPSGVAASPLDRIVRQRDLRSIYERLESSNALNNERYRHLDQRIGFLHKDMTENFDNLEKSFKDQTDQIGEMLLLLRSIRSCNCNLPPGEERKQ